MTDFIRGTNYRTLAGIFDEIETAAHSARVEMSSEQIGYSKEGRPIMAACFGDGDFRKPEVLYFATIHAMEFISSAVAMQLIRDFAQGGAHAALLDRLNVWIIPVLNPDGYARVEKMLTTGLGIAAWRKNANGVDLNRNFPLSFYDLPKSLYAGSRLKLSQYYRGPEPCSEPESRVLRDFILGHNVKMSLALHSFARCILHPYAHTRKPCKDHELFARIGAEMAALMDRPYSVKRSSELYQVNGDMIDWLYDECGILSFLMEIGGFNADPLQPRTLVNPFFWWNPMRPEKEIANVMPACLHITVTTDKMFGENA